MGSETIENYYKNGEALSDTERKITFANGKILQVKRIEAISFNFIDGDDYFEEIKNLNSISYFNQKFFTNNYGYPSSPQ